MSPPLTHVAGGAPPPEAVKCDVAHAFARRVCSASCCSRLVTRASNSADVGCGAGVVVGSAEAASNKSTDSARSAGRRAHSPVLPDIGWGGKAFTRTAASAECSAADRFNSIRFIRFFIQKLTVGTQELS